MSEPGQPPPRAEFDPQALLSLYGMYGGLGGFPGLPPAAAPTSLQPTSSSGSALPPTSSSTLGVAASQAQSLPLNPASAAWWSMASQLAAHDYMVKMQQQQAAVVQSNPQADYLSRLQAAARDPVALAALQAQGMVPSYDLGLNQGTKVRLDTPPRSASGTPTSGLENMKLPADTEILRKPGRDSPLLTLPAGLTIEKKKPGRKPIDPNYHVQSTGDVIDRVEITRIPRNGAALDMRKSMDREGETPLNLSLKSEPAPQNKSSHQSEYYASEALGGVFLAEQIRQQQLASQLQKHLQQPGGLTAMQALLSLGRLQQNLDDEGATKQNEDGSLDGKSRNLGRGNPTVRPKKNTVASLLAMSRGDADGEIPELTIQPLFNKSNSPGFDIGSIFRSDPQHRLSSEKDSEGHNSDTESNHPDSNGVNGKGSRKGTRQVVTDTEELKVPLLYGWKRETTIREFSKSGIRGEVVYVAPCGKRFKQYPDILRYIDKNGMSGQIKRTHFSFSTKLLVGDFLKPTGTAEPGGEEKYQRFTDDEMNDEIDRIRKENGWKPRKRGKSQQGRRNTVEGAGVEVDLVSLKEEEERRQRQEREQAILQKEALRILREAEKRDKADQIKREKERIIEEKKKKQDDLNRQRAEEKLKKLQELELKRQQSALLKEQEKERKREHMVLMKQFENRKKNDDRKKKIEEFKMEKERERERRTETRKLELEILAEMKKPVEDMAIHDAKLLPDIPRIPGLQLSGEAYANLLMVFEFIHNFGNTLSFDMDGIPSVGSLQAGLLNQDSEAEEELLNVLTHLVVCAVEDPGVPNPLKQLTILGQNLRQADVTNTNISEILRIYLRARAQYEIRLFHGLSPPEPKDKKEAIQGPFVNADTDYLNLIRENSTYKMSEWMEEKPFLCLNPTEKSEILAFICNELLSNKAVVNQIETTMENVQVTRRKKIALDNKAKKLKILHNRKYKLKVELPKNDDSTNTSLTSGGPTESETGEDKDELSNLSLEKEEKKGKGRKKGGGKGSKNKKNEDLVAESEEEEEEEMEVEEEDEAKEDDEDRQLSAEDLQKKIEKMLRQTKKKGEELTFLNNSLRATDMGQDRYRRRYWHLAHAGGIYLEGIESGEPWKLNTVEIAAAGSCSPPPAKKAKMEPEQAPSEAVKKEEDGGENKENTVVLASSTPLKQDSLLGGVKLSNEVSITPKSMPTNSKYTPKTTPNAERMNLFNHSAYFNMSLSAMVLNGSTISMAPSTNFKEAERGGDKAWFNLVAPQTEFHPGQSPTATETLPHLSLLEDKLQVLRQMNHETSRKALPRDKCFGWWKLDDESLVHQVQGALHQRGSREQNLISNLPRGYECVVESTRKVGQEELDLTRFGTDVKVEEEVAGAPVRDPRGSWSREVALRVEKQILEQIEGLEDKVASASMQVPGWKIPDRMLSDTLKFRPACPHQSNSADEVSTVEVSRTRLLELEAHIERRYLKAPLGQTKQATMQNISAATERNKNDDAMDVDEKEDDNFGEEEEDKENKEESNSGLKEGEDGKTDDQEGDKKAGAEAGVTKGLQVWREAVTKAFNAAQLAMAFYILESSIAWDKSIMKASCQFCHGEEDENALLLCDSCDRGFHTYCFKPELKTIPEGDWYCYECVNKATGLRHCLVCGLQQEEGLILCSSCPRAYHENCMTPPLAKNRRGKWQCPGCTGGKNPGGARKQARKARTMRNTEDEIQEGEDEVDGGGVAEEVEAPTPAPAPAPAVRATKKKSQRQPKVDKDMSLCQTLLSELGGHDESWPFINPVNSKQFPTYRKIIKNPMDITTIRKKLNEGVYKTRDDFKEDVHLLFTNCKKFNEDESPVGRAGHLMKLFFESRWAELTAG